MIDETGQNGINGTDTNVTSLFPDRPSAAPPGPQEEVVRLLEEFAIEAASGRHTGIMIISFNELGQHKEAMSGKIPFSYAVTALEKMKFGILVRDYAAQLQTQMNLQPK